MAKWIRTGEHHFCSECEEWALYEEDAEKECLSAFCPSCGMRMENSEKEPVLDEDEKEHYSIAGIPLFDGD